MKPLWVASVVKDYKDGVNREIFDIAFTYADSEGEAIHAITTYDWPETYWDTGRSVCRVRSIYQIDDGPPARKTAVPAADSRRGSKTTPGSIEKNRSTYREIKNGRKRRIRRSL